MKRKDFLKKSMALSAIGVTIPSILKAKKPTATSTYDKMIEQVGFNHLPNNESKTMNTVLHKANTRGHANHGIKCPLNISCVINGIYYFFIFLFYLFFITF